VAWEFDCPVDDCEFTYRANEEDRVVESGQQHMRDQHGDMPPRDEAVQYVTGPG
jgi:predicted small metal-binding protein